MAYRVRLLYFHEPIPALDSKGSLAGDVKVGGGAAVAESIRRVPQGYLVGWKNKVFFVPDSRISCAEIVDEEIEKDIQRAAGLAVDAEVVTPQVQAAATATPAAPVVLGPPPEPGSIAMDKFGRFYRVPFPEAPAAPSAAAPAPEPSPEGPAHTMTRSPRRRGSMSAKHETQPPTALEAAVAADKEQGE